MAEKPYHLDANTFCDVPGSGKYTAVGIGHGAEDSSLGLLSVRMDIGFELPRIRIVDGKSYVNAGAIIRQVDKAFELHAPHEATPPLPNLVVVIRECALRRHSDKQTDDNTTRMLEVALAGEDESTVIAGRKELVASWIIAEPGMRPWWLVPDLRKDLVEEIEIWPHHAPGGPETVIERMVESRRSPKHPIVVIGQTALDTLVHCEFIANDASPVDADLADLSWPFQ